MNILYIPTWYPTADNYYSGSFIQNLAKDIANKDFHITVVFPDSGIFLKNQQEEIEQNKYLKEYHLKFRFLPKGLSFLQDAWVNTCIKEIEKIIDISTFHIVHSHGFIASFIGSKIAKKHNKCHIVSYHYSGFLLDTIPQWRLSALKKNKTEYHISPSISLAQALKQKLNVEPIIIPNYIDFIPIKSSPINVKKSVLCLSVMYFEKVKNPITLIQEFAKLPTEYHLDMIGDGTLKPDALQLIEKLNLSERIRIIPTMTRDALLQKYQEYDLFISTSEVETFGMCLLEAIAAGVPVISVSNHGPSDFIHTENGILSSIKNLKDDIIKVVTSDVIKNPIRISQSVDAYRKQEIIPKYLELYQDVVKI